MTLSATQRCPIHKRLDCCGRSERPARGRMKAPRWKLVGPGVKQFPDGHIERTPAALTRRKNWLLQNGHTCAACHEPFDDYREVELAHRISKGSGGWKRDDSDGNLVLMHKTANRDQGSMDLKTYLATKWKPEICNGGQS